MVGKAENGRGSVMPHCVAPPSRPTLPQEWWFWELCPTWPRRSTQWGARGYLFTIPESRAVL